MPHPPNYGLSSRDERPPDLPVAALRQSPAREARRTPQDGGFARPKRQKPSWPSRRAFFTAILTAPRPLRFPAPVARGAENHPRTRQRLLRLHCRITAPSPFSVTSDSRAVSLVQRLGGAAGGGCVCVPHAVGHVHLPRISVSASSSASASIAVPAPSCCVHSAKPLITRGIISVSVVFDFG